MPGLSLRICMSDMKSVALTVLEQLSAGIIDMDTHGHTEQKQYLCHSFHSFGIDNNVDKL